MRVGTVVTPHISRCVAFINRRPAADGGRRRAWRSRLAPAVAGAFPLATASSLILAGVTATTAHASSPTITAYPTPTTGSNPYVITAGPDGNLWFAESSANKIGRITPTGAITEFPIPTSGSGAFGITAGPDGNLWFVESNANQIGQITPSGVVTEFSIPTGGSGPNGIAAGPDGNLWFTEYNTGQIGRITPAGVVAEFATTDSGSGPLLITSGPDGNMWFTEYNDNRIGQITTAGAVAEFAAGPNLSGPDDIVAGPDGNIWFTEINTNKIARISTSGTGLAEFATPTLNSQPNGITAGPNGALWFTEVSGGRIAEITTTGVITEFATPSGSTPYWVATGADGNVWFTDVSSNSSIDKVAVPATCARLSVSASPNTVDPGASVAIGMTMTNCGSAPLTNMTTATTTVGPNSCGTPPAIPPVTGTLVPGAAATASATVTAPLCLGAYVVSSQSTVGSTVVATSTTFYTVTSVAEFPASTLPQEITAGPDGNLWYTGGDQTVDSITPSGAITPFAIPSNLYSVLHIASGSDGNLWLSAAPNAIVRMTTVGSFVEFAMPGGSIAGLAAGPDGNVWFTDGGLNKIGRVTPLGKIKQFSLPSGVTPRLITDGPDGALWFNAGPEIGRITTAGVVTMFPLPSGSSAGSIASGADGNLWFTGRAGATDIVGRMTTSGTVAEFATPTQPSRPTVIAAGSDGDIWFTETSGQASNQAQIGRVAPDGTVTELTLSPGANPNYGIAAGGDGNMWVTEYYGAKVARIGTGASSACTPVAVTTNPTQVAVGGTETVTTRVQNCAATPQILKVVTKTTPPSGCGTATSTAVSVVLAPHTQTTKSSSLVAPGCTGSYKVQSTLSSGGTVLAKSSGFYQVS